MSILRTVRTVRHLRPSQLLWRLRYAAGRRRNLGHGTRGGRWRWAGAAPPAVRADFPDLPLAEAPEPRGAAAVELLAGGLLEHLNETRELGRERPDWRLGERSSERLWTVTMHYQAWAFALAEVAAEGPGAPAGKRRRAAELFRHYVADWIGGCGLETPGSAALAWNSFALATRLGWWIRAYRRAREELFAGDSAFEELFLRSLWQQAAYLHDHLEWDLLGNHLIRDLVGLAAAGRFFDEPDARRWLARAGRLARRQVPRQILADGGHYERSPKYHLDVLADLGQLAVLVEDRETRRELRRQRAAMAAWAAWMRHPDGGTAQFNDGAVLAAGAVADRLGPGREPGAPAGGVHLAATGMVAWHDERWSVFFDVGEIAAAEQPGHGHADTLSIECSYRGRRLIVDPGSFDYDAGERRRYDRSTGAHNTVVVDGKSSSETWQIFRVGRRARPREVAVELAADGFTAAAAHDGYDHLPGRPRHHRTVRLDGAGALAVEDTVEGAGVHHLQGGLLIDQAWRVTPSGDGWRLSGGAREVDVRVEGPSGLERFTEERWHHPDYGVERTATRLGWRCRTELPFRSRVTLAEGGRA